MADASAVEMVTIAINDHEIQVPKGELIVESVKRLGLEIPIFCYHPRMKPVGMCRMCLVEVGFKQPDGSVRKMPKPQAGCTLPASEGMVIYTDSEMVHRDRKGVLEFLLINHPLDCPICDRGGECPLQNNAIFYGPSTSRFTELKRHAAKAYPLSEYVTLDLERCIQCGRCVRFTEEISGDHQLAFRFRGANMQPSTFQLTDFESKFSGNTIEICPVGALTSSKYRFRARPWDLEARDGVCLECANQCAIHFDYRAGKFVRVSGRTNEAINEEWTCDKGKFGHEFYNSDQRLTRVLIRDIRHFRSASWLEAYEEILKKIEEVGGDKVGILVGGRPSNEALFLMQKFAREVIRTPHIDHRWTRFVPGAGQRIEDTMGMAPIQSRIADLEEAQSILLFGGSMADQQPMVYLRARKAWARKHTPVVVVSDSPTEADHFAAVCLRYRPGSAGVVARGLLAMLAPEMAASDADLHRLTPEVVARESGVSVSDLQKAAELLRGGTTVVTSEQLLNEPHGFVATTALATLCQGVHGSFNQYKSFGNAQGAEDMGFAPDRQSNGSQPKVIGMTGPEILKAAAEFELQVLWLIDADPFALCEDHHLVKEALENVETLIVQQSVANESTGYASIVLPAAAPAEQDGTYTNIDRHVQRFKQVLPTLGEAKAHWRIAAELLLRAQPSKPYFNAAEITEAIAAEVPGYEGVAGAIGPEGVALPLQSQVVEASR